MKQQTFELVCPTSQTITALLTASLPVAWRRLANYGVPEK